ncbi:hypothetical protein [Bacillus haynesii]|uniref:hypothetical protein n=1 Tax=Bacillus haynesii TaxID=1925021 RepID=UPI001C23F9A3|nr:hypothetical protein [Bacillus haynesii]MBU8681999.1 hypothetical protein [Bacillus haynesii]
MTWLEFFSNVIKSIIWPLALVIIVFALKKPVSSLINTLVKIKYKDWEVEFDMAKRIEKLDEGVNEISSEIVFSEEQIEKNSVIEKDNNHSVLLNDKDKYQFNSLEDYLDILDQSIVDLYTVTVKPDERIGLNKNFLDRDRTVNSMARYLFEKAVIDEKLFNLIIETRKMLPELNEVEHSRSLIKRYKGIVKNIVSILKYKRMEKQERFR